MRFLIILIIFCSFNKAQAWWEEPHRAMCKAAINFISTQEKKEEILELIEDEEEWCIWADDIKNDRPKTRPWHYVNLAKGDLTYSSSDCPRYGCIVSALLKQISIYQNPKTPLWKKKEALKFIGHFVGDVHQPFHVADVGDVGGNRMFLELWDGTKTNFHALWDGILPGYALQFPLQKLDLSLISAKERILTPEERISVWIRESRELLQEEQIGYVQRLKSVNREYVLENTKVAYYQLSLGATRLAALLEDI